MHDVLSESLVGSLNEERSSPDTLIPIGSCGLARISLSQTKWAPAESVVLGIEGPFLIGSASDGESAGGGLRLIRRIELRNYMSHARTVIDLAEGLTVLVGPNNCGKSAIVSALQTLCQNTTGDYMRRHGERECSVRVATDDGHVLEWRADPRRGELRA